MKGWLILFAAIIAEVIGTMAMKSCEGFTKPIPTLIMAVCYGIAFFCLSIILKTIPVGIAYAIWSGAGIVLIALVGYFVFKQSLDLPAIIGMGMIVAGVLIMNLFSKSVAH